MPLPENGGGGGWVPVDGALFRTGGAPEVWAYFQGRRFWIRTGDIAAALWGAGWPSLIADISPDWLSLDRGRDIVQASDWAAIMAGDWAAPAPTPEDPNWRPEPDDPNEEVWAQYGEGVLEAIRHEGGNLLGSIGRAIPRLAGDAKEYRLELRRIRKDWG